MSELPYRVEKPWGHELIWAKTSRYVGKILHIEPGHVLSLQYHNRKDESIYVLSGEIVLRIQQGETLIERPLREEIGRASCRERVESAVGGGAFKTKRR